MTTTFFKRRHRSTTKAAILERILRDGQWHSTYKLVLLVGHTFAVAKFQLVKFGYAVERRRHPSHKRQWQYRMVNRREIGG